METMLKVLIGIAVIWTAIFGTIIYLGWVTPPITIVFALWIAPIVFLWAFIAWLKGEI